MYFIAALITAFAWYSCTKEERLDHVDENAPAPAPITEIKTQATPGGAKLIYKIPVDKNLAYIKAIYEIQPGVFREAKSSIYTDTLSLVGFGAVKTYDVRLYSVGKNEKESNPVAVQVTPLAPPVQTVFETLELNPTFSGVNIAFKNDTRADLAAVVMVDSTGKNTWAPLTTYYTESAAVNFSARGQKSIEKKFAVFLRDRWNNKSDTLIKLLTPKFEIEIPKTTWKPVSLDNDEKTFASANFKLEYLYDNKWSVLSGQSYASGNASKLPQSFTLDLGKKILMSRFKEHQAPTSHLYVSSAVKRFELWGSNNPSQNGSWDNWQLLGTFESHKPSGTPVTTAPTAEDKNYGNVLGEDFEFAIPPPAVRYIRWKTLETYSSTGQVVISEITLFGEVVQ